MTTGSTLEQYAAAWRAGDVTGMLDAYADDVVFHYSGETDLAGDHVGKDAAVTAMISASTRSTRTLVEVVDVMAGESLGAIVAIERFERDGESRDVQRVLLYRIEADRIAECWLYDTDQRLIDRFWAP
jgi:hypothetical protein